MVTIAVTGAGRGIDLELAKQHLQAGDRVLALVRDRAKAETLGSIAAGSGGRLTIYRLDVRDLSSVRKGALSTGDGPIDILYNVAGLADDAKGKLDDIDWDRFDEVVDVGLKGPLRVLQAFLPRLSRGSKVINLSSQIGGSTWPKGGYYAYAATKAGLNRLMRSIAIDLKDKGVIVGIVHRGWVRTDMGGSQAAISPDESARGIRALALDWTLDRSGEFLKWDGEPQLW